MFRKSLPKTYQQTFASTVICSKWALKWSLVTYPAIFTASKSFFNRFLAVFRPSYGRDNPSMEPWRKHLSRVGLCDRDVIRCVIKNLEAEKLLMIWLGLLKWKWWDFQQKIGEKKNEDDTFGLKILTGNNELAKHFSVETVDSVHRFLVDGEAVAFQSSGQCQS